LGNQKLDVTAHVAAELAMSMIIGMDVMQKWGVMVDCGKEEIIVSGSRFPMFKRNNDREVGIVSTYIGKMRSNQELTVVPRLTGVEGKWLALKDRKLPFGVNVTEKEGVIHIRNDRQVDVEVNQICCVGGIARSGWGGE